MRLIIWAQQWLMAVATVLTVYGIETEVFPKSIRNTHFVATVLTVYGIETLTVCQVFRPYLWWLQQYLPFTVLKHSCVLASPKEYHICCNSTYRLRYWNRLDASHIRLHRIREVATVLTVYGIETGYQRCAVPSLQRLQQYLPFTVLKLISVF